jgi:hypothetical protein
MGVVTPIRALLGALSLVACQGQGHDAPSVARDPTSPAPPTDAKPTPVVAPPPRSAKALVAALGAVPAWEGVVQRWQWLARRGQRGALYGRVGPAVGEGGLIWLIDDTEGGGCLAVRAAFPGAAPPLGALVVATGAWMLPDSSTRWVWQVESSTGLPDDATLRHQDPVAPSGGPSAGPNSATSDGSAGDAAGGDGQADGQDDPATAAEIAARSAIGHEPASSSRPAAAQWISKAKDHDLALFQVLAAPKRLGEGWLVADQLGNPPVAVLFLPGDRPSYGGMDFRQPDEVWRLRRGVTYAVRIGKVRRKDPTKPAVINARNAPIKVPG